MGCASSAHMISATGERSKPPQQNVPSSIPTGEVVLKDLPEVVEKVIDVLKEGESEIGHPHTKEVGSPHLLNSKFGNSDTVFDANKIVHDTDSENSQQGIVQGFLTDNVSTYSKQSDQENIESHYNLEENNGTVSADVDSLRTSSPESEIEEALANSNDQNPPTPKPTFSELQDLAMLPINTVKHIHGSKSSTGENIKVNNYSNKSENNLPVELDHLTDWEKQADILAVTRKFNPIEAIRKYRKENRSSSSLPHRGNPKPKSQRYFEEDLSELFPTQSPLRSDLSSAKSERNMKPNSSDPDPNASVTSLQNDVLNQKVEEAKLKKTPDNKRKGNSLTVSQNGRKVPSPSLYKVRERCAVCCNKYKH